MSREMNFFATAPKGMEHLLAEELRALGALEVKEVRAGVSFRGGLEAGYRACLWSRLASRVLLALGEFPAATPEQLYDGVRGISWAEHLGAEGSLAVDATGATSGVTHSRYAALKVKDAVVDQFRDGCGLRPSVDLERPDVRLNLYLHRDAAVLSLDLGGGPLHRRGYRLEGVAAPLKENLAAAILVRAGWPLIAREGGGLIDPMCGSGTLAIEGALMAADIAPGLLRPWHGLLGWRWHDPELWEKLLEEARERRIQGLASLPSITGFDASAGAIRAAWANLEQAGLSGRVHFERRDVADLAPPASARPGLVAVNPPYGERLGEEKELEPLYRTLGERLRGEFVGWRAALLTGNPELGHRLGLRARRYNTLYNGALECRLLHFDIAPEWFSRDGGAPRSERAAPAVVLGEGAQMFANRLRKNLKSLGRWARGEGISCYRLYDADIPEYAVAVDLYGDRVHVQEYEAPPSIDPKVAESRLREVMAVLPGVLDIPAEKISLKVRRRQKGGAQYQKQAAVGEFLEVEEGGCRLLVNLTDYLDTGLFLDHRPTRAMIQAQASGKRFLNLFAYTATATVHAAKGGAAATVSVDMSSTYLDWARRNLALNGFAGPSHRLVQSDVLPFLDQCRERFDLIFLDPPTYSRSKRMEGDFDIQRDHLPLLQAAARLLAPGGVLIFSTNSRRFVLDGESLEGLRVEEITGKTIPRDFARNPRIHHCWRLTLS